MSHKFSQDMDKASTPPSEGQHKDDSHLVLVCGKHVFNWGLQDREQIN